MQEAMQGCKEQIDRDINALDGRMTKLENEAEEFRDSLTSEMGELSEEVRHEIHCLDNKIEAETARAIAREDEIDAKIDGLQDQITEEVNRAQEAEQNLDNKIDAEIDRATAAEAQLEADGIVDAEFVPNDKKIYFKNKAGENVAEIDADAFIIDGMVKDVRINQGNLEIIWNSDAGDKITRIALDDIFRPEDYYTKVKIDEFLSQHTNDINALRDTDTSMNSAISQLHGIVENTNNAGATLEFGDTTQIATVNNKIITVGLPSLPVTVDSVTTDGAKLFVHTTDGNMHSYDLPGGYIQIVNNHDTRIENLENIINGQGGQGGGVADDVASLLARVQALEQLWYLDTSNNRVTTVGGKAAVAGGFYDSTM